MAKITSVANGETGAGARGKINTAIATVETDATITGDGNVGTVLSVDSSELDSSAILNGTFTGSIISDNVSIEAGMQELEDAIPNTTDNCRIGFFDYNDAATVSTPISVTGGAGFVELTNDGLGAFTNKTYKPAGVTDVWDATTDRFDWTELSLGDMVDIRLDIEVTTASPNTNVIIKLEMGIGASAYTIPFFELNEKNAEPHEINVYNGVYMGDTNTLNNPARFVIEADSNSTVVVRGWYCKILIRG